MSSAIEISRARISLLWVHTFTDLLADPATPGAPMAFLGRKASYTERFGRALRGKDPDGLEPPWPRPAGQLFWTYYLESMPPGQLPAKDSWRLLVPLRQRAPFDPQATQSTCRVLGETFYHPHGYATMVSLQFLQRRPLAGFLDDLASFADDGLAWVHGSAKIGGVPAFARDCMVELRRRVLGVDMDGAPPRLSFCVASIIAGSGVDPQHVPNDTGEVHRALAALVRGGSPTWRVDKLDPLAGQVVPTRGNSPPSHVMYASKRGRVLWFPTQFSTPDGGASLQCYHRNLCYAALQVESLCELATLLAERVRKGTLPLSAAETECARLAAGLLGRLYGGEQKSTYRSMSVLRHIKERALVDINFLRARYHMTALS
jgi:hypothetical protein